MSGTVSNPTRCRGSSRAWRADAHFGASLSASVSFTPHMPYLLGAATWL